MKLLGNVLDALTKAKVDNIKEELAGLRDEIDEYLKDDAEEPNPAPENAPEDEDAKRKQIFGI